MIPYGRQDITEEDIQAVVEVLRSDMITTGPKIPEFENTLCEYTGAKYSVSVNSATSALHIACLSLGLGEGDILWTSPLSFVASSNCALYCQASVNFVDIDPKTYVMDIDLLHSKLIEAKSTETLPKIVVPVHFAGQSCDMEAIHALSTEFGFHIIEDAAHAIGGTYKGGPIGSCQYSDITIFSFHPVKIITTCEGGAALTNNHFLANKMSELRSHGIVRDFDNKPTDEPWLYAQESLGFNYRMTDVSAALGISQMSRIDKYITTRHDIAGYYDNHLGDLPVSLPLRNDISLSALHLYPIRITSDTVTRKQVYNSLISQGVGAQIHYKPIHTQPYYQQLGFKEDDFPVSVSVYNQILSLPIFPTLKRDEQDKVISLLREILDA